MTKRLGVGIVGSGFMAKFHVQSWLGVRHADIQAIASRNSGTSLELASLCESLGVGSPTTYSRVREMVRDPKVEAVWFVAPNDVRLELIQEICEEVREGRSGVRAIAVEKPLARTVREAKSILQAVNQAGLLHGYLENQVFAPSLVRGRELIWERGAKLSGPPYLARCAEEHSGPHRTWFWSGPRQGGGVLNDMMCHSLEAGRFLLSSPEDGTAPRPISVTASIASLKWGQERYARELSEQSQGELDYLNSPAEDYARAEIVYERPDGSRAITEATTSWSFVGAGLRLMFEALGPEYSLEINSLHPGSSVFFSRRIDALAGEDLLEKQNAERGVMPFIPDEAGYYGYTNQNRHMVEAFRNGSMPDETLEDGLRITSLLMACYQSAEEQRTITFDQDKLEAFIPAVAKGTWNWGRNGL